MASPEYRDQLSRKDFLKFLGVSVASAVVGTKLIEAITPEKEFVVNDECDVDVYKSTIPHTVDANAFTVPVNSRGDSIIVTDDPDNIPNLEHELGHSVDICERKKGFWEFLKSYFKNTCGYESYADRQVEIQNWREK